MEARLDGNAVGGALSAVFGVELTTAVGVCGSCGTRGTVAELHAYVRAPGFVVRCAACESVLIRIVEGPDRTWIDLSGLRTLELRH